jgi:hypothetical protein
MARPDVPPNKQFSIDNRALAPFQNVQLKNNPLSIFTTNPDAEIPALFQDSKPADFANLKASYSPEGSNGGSGTGGGGPLDYNYNSLSDPSEPVYPLNNDFTTGAKPNINPNAELLYNNNNGGNQMIDMTIGARPNSPVEYPGLAYSGRYNPNELMRTNSGDIFVQGPASVTRPRTENDIGIENNNTTVICENNPAVSFSNNLMINRDLM